MLLAFTKNPLYFVIRQSIVNQETKSSKGADSTSYYGAFFDRKAEGNMINYDIKTKVAATQFEPVWYNAHETITKMIQWMKEASENGAKLIGFAECAIPGYAFDIWGKAPLEVHMKDKLLSQNSLEIDGPEMQRLMIACKENNIYLVTGFVERDGGSRYISQVIINDEGKIVLTRRKLKPTDCERYVYGDGSGADLKVAETPIGIIGACNCFEHVQPLITYAMASMHEQIHVASWPGVEADYPYYLYSTFGPAKDMSRVYAMQTQTYTLTCSAVYGPSAQEFFYKDMNDKVFKIGGGLAQVISPMGNYLCEPLPSDQEGIVYADIDLNLILETKAFVDPVGQYSRPDILSLNINKSSFPKTRVTNEKDVDPSLIEKIERANQMLENA